MCFCHNQTGSQRPAWLDGGFLDSDRERAGTTFSPHFSAVSTAKCCYSLSYVNMMAECFCNRQRKKQQALSDNTRVRCVLFDGPKRGFRGCTSEKQTKRSNGDRQQALLPLALSFGDVPVRAVGAGGDACSRRPAEVVRVQGKM